MGTFWLLAFIFYDEADAAIITRREMWQELVIYVLVEALAWYTSVWEFPKAYSQFYFGEKSIMPNPDYEIQEQGLDIREEVQKEIFEDVVEDKDDEKEDFETDLPLDFD